MLLSPGPPVPRLAGHGGFCPSPRARTGQGCFLPTLLPSGDGCLPAGPSVPRISLSPPSPRVCLQDPCPIRGVLVDEPGCPAGGSWQREGATPGLVRSPQSMPAPACTLGQEGEIPLLCESWRIPTSAVRSGVQASPFTSAGATAAPAGDGSSPGPPGRQDQGEVAAMARHCLCCWAHRRGLLSSSALVWCLEPGPVSALPNRDLWLANAPRCASVSPGLGEWQLYAIPLPQRQVLCMCAAPACTCPSPFGEGNRAHLNPPAPLGGGWCSPPLAGRESSP